MRDSIEKIAGSARAPLTHDERGAALITVLLFAVLMLILITTMLTVTGIVEFVSTLWVRNVVLQRGVSVLPGTTM